MTTDNRIVYGALCIWWDGIEKVGRNGVLPCCPHCKGVLFEMNSPKQWWDGVEAHEANGHPGYRDFIEWLKGKCYPTTHEAKKAYEASGKRTVVL